MSKDKPKRAKPDSLVKPGKAGQIELSESDLKKVTGGGTANKATTSSSTGPTENLSLNFTKVNLG
ncbi:MAG TPA: hypothetical protein VHE77_01945 [Dongiaceae bacterium]|nr:hypothetical protein [Dongiaceae bacterium]